MKESDDELGQLIDSFNEMVTEIQSRDDELLKHRNSLELTLVPRNY